MDAQLSLTLLTLHDEAQEQIRELDKRRKNLKESASRQERQLLDEENVRDKAVTKYELLNEEWSRLNRGDGTKRSNFTFKSSWSGQQKNSDELKHKLDHAHTERDARISSAARTRQALIAHGRPRSVAAFVELLHEIDAELSSLLIRTAHAHEDSVLQKAMIMAGEATASESTSAKRIVASINHRKRSLTDPEVSSLTKFQNKTSTTGSRRSPEIARSMLHLTARTAALSKKSSKLGWRPERRPRTLMRLPSRTAKRYLV